MRVASLAILALSAWLLASPTSAQQVMVAGELVLSEPFAIAENSSVQVRLIDLDATEAVAVDGDELSIGPETAQPIAFSFGVFADQLSPDGRYALEARLYSRSEAQGRGLIFETAGPVPVDPLGGAPVVVTLAPSVGERVARVGTWFTRELAGVTLEAERRPVSARLIFDNGRGLTLLVGCGAIFADVAFDYTAVAVSNIEPSGLGGCADVVDAFENAGLAVLEAVRSVAFDDAGALLLFDEAGAPLAIFTPASR